MTLDTDTTSTTGPDLEPADWQALQVAYRHLEHPSLAARLTALIGVPIEKGLRMLPHDWNRNLRAALHGGVERILGIALSTMPLQGSRAGLYRHMALGGGIGAVAGLLGAPALLAELPISTAIMLRSIASVASEHGENPVSTRTRAECIKVFALGGRPADDNEAETGYYGLRLMLSLHFAPAAASGARLPSSIGFVRSVANRFGAALTDKAAAQTVPVVGAISAGLINAAFIRHFHDIAQGHFTVRRLERAYGKDVIRNAYAQIRAGSAE